MDWFLVFLGVFFCLFSFFSGVYTLSFSEDFVYYYSSAIGSKEALPESYSGFFDLPVVNFLSFIPASLGFFPFTVFWSFIIFVLFPLFMFFLSGKNPWAFVLSYCVPFAFMSWYGGLLASFILGIEWLVSIYFFLCFKIANGYWSIPFLYFSLIMSSTHHLGFLVFFITFILFFVYSFFSKQSIYFLSVIPSFHLGISKRLVDLPFIVSFFKFLCLPLLIVSFLVKFDFRHFVFVVFALVSFLPYGFGDMPRVLVFASPLLVWISADYFKTLEFKELGYFIVFFCFLAQIFL